MSSIQLTGLRVTDISRCGGWVGLALLERVMSESIMLSRHEAVYDRDYVENLEAKNANLREALEKIASGDYDPEEIAENALALEAGDDS